jgi:hypothetical protein
MTTQKNNFYRRYFMMESFTPTAAPRIKVVFEFSALKPKLTHYRGVQAIDGGFRMEKRGDSGKKFKPFMWCGSIEGLCKHRETIERHYECRPLVRVEAHVF